MMSIPLTTRRLPAAFQRLAWSNLAAQSAEQIALAAAPLIAVLAFGAGAGETGWLQTAQTLPFLLLAIPVGLLADRGSRQRLMVFADRLMRSLRFGTVVAIGPVSAALSSLLMMGTLLWRSPIPAALSFFLFGAGPIVWVISTNTLRQRVTPDALMARAGALMTTAQGARPIGAALAAVVGGYWGASACLALASAAFLAQAALVLTSPLVRLAACPGSSADPGERNDVRLRSA
ncbi:MAG TPA: MFS transporter [Burkholderiaceae bacterium]|nr:MFS transporter [Burkholderiaceae bacterium]